MPTQIPAYQMFSSSALPFEREMTEVGLEVRPLQVEIGRIRCCPELMLGLLQKNAHRMKSHGCVASIAEKIEKAPYMQHWKTYFP